MKVVVTVALRTEGLAEGLREKQSSHTSRIWVAERVCYLLSHVRLFGIPWTVARQAPLSIGFSRQEYWSELPFPSPGDLPNPRIEPGSPALGADSLPTELPGKPKEVLQIEKKL